GRLCRYPCRGRAGNGISRPDRRRTRLCREHQCSPFMVGDFLRRPAHYFGAVLAQADSAHPRACARRTQLRYGPPCRQVHAAACGSKDKIDAPEGLVAKVKPNAFRRLATNLISDAARFGKRVAVAARSDGHQLTVTVDDDGPGIPETMREDVFRPFVRLDEARNQDETGTGLGLSIARDIARAHGGDITLEESPLGGLRAVG